jgi:ketosteroid isomerase-like protein
MSASISQLMETQVNAFLSGDLEPFLNCFADDATILPSTAAKPIQKATGVRRWIKTNAQTPKYTMRVVKSEEGNDFAYQLIRYSGANTSKAGRTAKFSGYLTRVMKRQNGEWKIVCAVWKDDE